MFLPAFLILIAAGVSAESKLQDFCETAYPIPDDAIFVSVSGSDLQPGSPEAPIRNIATAINRAPNGGTVVIRGGTYRETLPALHKRLTLQPYPHEQVWLKGSVETIGWAPEGRRFRKDGWLAKFNSHSYEPQEISADHPLAGRADMVFIDGNSLKQVGAKDDVAPGTFFVDENRHALYIGDDPQGKLVEAARFGHALELSRGSRGSIVRGLGFAHYANIKYEGAVRLVDGIADVLLENDTFADNAGTSLLIYESRNVTLRGNKFVRAGYQGVSAWKTANLSLESNVFAENNQEYFETAGDFAAAAGVKICASTGITVRNNQFLANHCTGLWFDLSCRDCSVVFNRCRNNERAGIHVELSAHAIVAGNRVEQNGEEGIYISNSSDVQVYNNRVADNVPNIAIQDDKRVNTDPAERAKGISYITGGVDVVNNLLILSKGGGPMLWVRDYNSSPRKPASQMVARCDYNCWRYPTNGGDVNLIEWWGDLGRRQFHDLETFRAETGHESHGLEQEYDGTEAPLEKSGQPLPPDIAEVLGLSAGADVPIGIVDSGPKSR